LDLQIFIIIESIWEKIRKFPPSPPSLLPVISSDTGEVGNAGTGERRYEKAHEAFT
jgi:hypothetical protein